MKKYFTFMAFAAATVFFAACGAKEEEETTKENAPEEETVGIKIAYVELDTLMSQYQLYKDYSEVLTRKGNNIQKTLEQKQRTLESHAAAVQKRYDNNEFTTRDEVERAQASIEKEQRDLAELADRLQNEFALEQSRSLTPLISAACSRHRSLPEQSPPCSDLAREDLRWEYRGALLRTSAPCLHSTEPLLSRWIG